MATTTYDVNTQLVLGEEMYLYVTSANTPVAFATSCSVQIDGETIDTSNKMSGRWNSNLAGKNGYTISADALYTQETGLYSFDSLMEKMIAGGKLEWVIGKATDYKNGNYELDTTKPYYSGTGFVTSLSLNAGNNEVASSSITITGSGAIELKKPGA
jgi:predicted secreted protein